MELDEQLLSVLNRRVTSEDFYHIRELLMKGADPNIIDSNGNGPIHLAIKNSPKNLDLVLELIRFRSNINTVNKYGSTALFLSIYKRCHQTTVMLIKKGIDLNFQCQRGWTALMIATMIGNLLSVRILLQHGANANIYDKHKRTALMFATECSNLYVIKELLAYGANPGMCNVVKKTALYIVLENFYPNLDIVNELLLHCASFENLEENSEASFKRIMKICLRGKPPYHPCVKTIIKIQMLLTRNYDCVTNFKDLYNFASKCCTEISYMKYYNVSKCDDVESLLQKCLRGYMPNEKELEVLLILIANDYFKIYSDILKAFIKTPYLRKRFLKMLISAKKEGQANEITLTFDVNIHILSYLSKDDVFNFLMAYYSKTRYVDSSMEF